MLKFTSDQMTTLFSAISALKTLYVPVEKGGEVTFGVWSEEETVRLDALKTVKSAKDLFFPQAENMMSFKVEGKKIDIQVPEEKMDQFVVFGVRACDAKSFEVLDKVFLAEPVDSYYALRRKSGIVICAACTRPEESCFCNVFGIDATAPAGDIVTWTVDGTLYWEAKTEKGEAFTAELSAYLAEATAEEEAAVAAQNEAVKAIIAKLPYANLKVDGFTGDRMMEFFNSPKWEELYQACLGCGTCTFVCPTCQCYDIRDYDTGHGVQRYRCWDSCMYSEFTKMAGGQPRLTQLERFRQRFMHKLVYYPMNNDGLFSCVGCGRCVNKCPISMNIAKVIKALGDE